MGDRTAIEWTDASWNPTRGCSRVSPGCVNCYAERQAARSASTPGGAYEGLLHESGAWNGKVRFVEQLLQRPLLWSKPRRIFVDSMSDLFHESIPDDWIDRIFAVMAMCPQHTFQVLTKRAQRMQEYLSDPEIQMAWGFEAAALIHRMNGGSAEEAARVADDRGQPAYPLPNVWLGVSVEDQERAEERIQALLQTPAAVRFLSCEPLLGPINLNAIHGHGVAFSALECGVILPEHVDWVIVGGESGPRARPMHVEWARRIRNQCRAAGVAFFMKQGSQANWPGYKDFASFPADLQVREWPLQPETNRGGFGT